MAEVSTQNFGEWLQDAGLGEPRNVDRGDGWSIWAATLYQDGTDIERHYVYITPSCPRIELERSAAAIAKFVPLSAGTYSVIFAAPEAPQLQPAALERTKLIFPRGNIITLQKFYYSAAVNKNLRIIDAAPVENFVEQRVSFPGFVEPQPALTTAVKWLRGEINTKQKIAVLLAPGGQGKTTLAKQIFHHFTAQPFEATIPVLIRRNSWETNRDLNEIEDVWRYGIRECYPDAGLTLEMLQRCLLLGAVCPIIDGLDELCTVFPWDFKPDETIGELLRLYDGSFDGRLLITSRLTFWTQYISPNLYGKVLEIQLHKFSQQERDEYLRSRYPEANPSRRERATRVLARIASRTATYRSEQSTNVEIEVDTWEPYKGIEAVPFVVMLAADSADTEQSDLSAAYGERLESADPLRGLLLAICERDKLRHSLPPELTPEAQLRLFETLAGQFGDRISEEELEIALADEGLQFGIKVNLADHSLLVD